MERVAASVTLPHPTQPRSASPAGPLPRRCATSSAGDAGAARASRAHARHSSGALEARHAAHVAGATPRHALGTRTVPDTQPAPPARVCASAGKGVAAADRWQEAQKLKTGSCAAQKLKTGTGRPRAGWSARGSSHAAAHRTGARCRHCCRCRSRYRRHRCRWRRARRAARTAQTARHLSSPWPARPAGSLAGTHQATSGGRSKGPWQGWEAGRSQRAPRGPVAALLGGGREGGPLGGHRPRTLARGGCRSASMQCMCKRRPGGFVPACAAHASGRCSLLGCRAAHALQPAPHPCAASPHHSQAVHPGSAPHASAHAPGAATDALPGWGLSSAREPALRMSSGPACGPRGPGRGGPYATCGCWLRCGRACAWSAAAVPASAAGRGRGVRGARGSVAAAVPHRAALRRSTQRCLMTSSVHSHMAGANGENA